MKQTKPAMAGRARSSLLNAVFDGPHREMRNEEADRGMGEVAWSYPMNWFTG